MNYWTSSIWLVRFWLHKFLYKGYDLNATSWQPFESSTQLQRDTLLTLQSSLSVCISKLDDNYLQTFKAAQSERRHTKLARCCLETGCLPSANLCNYNKHPQVEGFVHWSLVFVTNCYKNFCAIAGKSWFFLKRLTFCFYSNVTEPLKIHTWYWRNYVYWYNFSSVNFKVKKNW